MINLSGAMWMLAGCALGLFFGYAGAISEKRRCRKCKREITCIHCQVQKLSKR